MVYKRIFVFLFLFSIFFVIPKIVYGQCDPDPTIGCNAAGVLQIQELITRIINISVGIAFFALTAYLIWGAVKFFITSGGDPKAVQQAWQVVIWAIVGLLFLVLAWLVLQLVESFTGVQVTKFCIGFPGAPTNCP